MDLLQGLKVLILGVLRERPHPTHFCLEEGLEIVEKLKPEEVYLTHIGHKLEHGKTEERLPEQVKLAYDGLVLEI